MIPYGKYSTRPQAGRGPQWVIRASIMLTSAALIPETDEDARLSSDLHRR